MARERQTVPDPSELKVTIGDENKVTTNFKTAVTATINTLRRNAALDREELDFLWWVQLARSRLLKCSLVSLDEPARLVAAGIEGATHLRRLPAEVHHDLVLRTVDADPELDLGELLQVLGAHRETLGKGFAGGSATHAPTVFPLLNALVSGAHDGPEANIKRKASDWGGRALLEAGLIGMMKTGAVGL